jgi:hypothetical protein
LARRQQIHPHDLAAVADGIGGAIELEPLPAQPLAGAGAAGRGKARIGRPGRL